MSGEEEKPVYSVAAKQVSVQSLPPVLTLHVKRFRQTVKGRSVKIDKHVVFPVLLDMKPYCGNSDVVSDATACRFLLVPITLVSSMSPNL